MQKKKKKRRLKKWVKRTLSYLTIVTAFIVGNLELSVVEAQAYTTPESNLLVLSNQDSINQILKTKITDKIVIDQISTNKPGLQLVNVLSRDPNSLVVESKIIPTIIRQPDAPKLKVVKDEVTVNLNAEFNPMSFLSYIDGGSTNGLPVLQIESNVDTSKEGDYQINYQATNLQGLTAEKTVTIHVKEHEEQRRLREEAERKAREEAERRAREEAARIEAERQAQLIAAQQAAATPYYTTTTSATPQYGGGSNPYSGGWGNCTWGAWQLAHDIAGVSLPSWGNAGTWLWSAQSSGYATGSEPRANSIVVMSNHVAFVTGVSGDQIYVKEGNFAGSYHEGWCPGYGSVYGQAIIGYIYL